MNDNQADIKENDIFRLSPKLLETLLADRTMSTKTRQVNIFWATDNYASRGKGYQYSDRITLEAITGENGNVIVPRALKSREEKQRRIRQMAEVFTPAWVCNLQCNMIDDIWFGREGVFNTEVDNPDGSHTWIVNTDPVGFPEGKTWQEYVSENRMEITCGEAPYLASRYDAVSGVPIPVERRIGFLDRKLRIAGENTSTPEEWIEAAKAAFKSTYGYEWQGDNLVLARESLLFTFIDYYRAKFGTDPNLNLLHEIAYIVSWNIWQMDGLKCVIPNSCERKAAKKVKAVQQSLFGEEEPSAEGKPQNAECPGCKKRDMWSHIGIYCKIMDWEEGKPIRFVSLYNNGQSK